VQIAFPEQSPIPANSSSLAITKKGVLSACVGKG
jgi:hypothetical protein